MKGITTKKSKKKHGTLKYKPNISLEHFTAICAWFPHQDENKIRTQCVNPTKPRGHQHFLTNTEIIPFLTNTEIIPVQWMAGVKKIPSPAATPKHKRKVLARIHTGNGALCKDGAGVQGFSWPAWEVFSYSMIGGFFPQQAKFFFKSWLLISCILWCMVLFLRSIHSPAFLAANKHINGTIGIKRNPASLVSTWV